MSHHFGERWQTDAMGRPQTIDEYVAGFTGPARETLEQLCTLAREAVPSASEAIKWNSPAWVHTSGTILFMISGHKDHANVAFTLSTRAAFESELNDVATTKAAVQVRYGDPVPRDLLRRMIAYRVREHEQDGVRWM